MAIADDFWAGRRVLVTGHAGFKGRWLTRWLVRLGAEVVPLGADLRSAAAVRAAVERAAPEVVLHLAARSLVGRAARDPAGTFAVNVLGTVNLLEAVRVSRGPVRAVLCVTTDRVYAPPHGGDRAHAEDDPLGGQDPYTASKAGQELVAAAYRAAFLAERGIGVATARAGNVIGGGDWAEDRLVPDLMRAALGVEPLSVRSPAAVLPWQHVLDTLDGYLRLARGLWEAPGAHAGGWNLGPSPDDARSVRWLVEAVRERWPGPIAVDFAPGAVAPATVRLDCTRAREALGWAPRWGLEAALDATVEWYLAHRDGADLGAVCDAQLERFAACTPAASL